MKRTLLRCLLLAMMVGALPLLCFLPSAGASAEAAASFTSEASPTAAPEPEPSPNAASSSQTEESRQEVAQTVPSSDLPRNILLRDSDSGTVLDLSVTEYLVGAAASEMSALWPDHAILAQMVASHSYVLYQRAQNDAPENGWISVAPARRQGYITAEVRRSLWGSDFEAHEARLQGLAAQVQNAVLTWEGQPAAACYHSVSAGRTEASQNVWVEALPYLQGVESLWDQQAEGCVQSIEYSPQQVRDALANGLGLAPGEDAAQWFGAAQQTAAGYVQTIEVCGTPIAGTALRRALALRSTCFTISLNEGKFHILTKGYGHCVGLSQWGAKYMAEQGHSWQEILQYYYPGTLVVFL